MILVISFIAILTLMGGLLNTGLDKAKTATFIDDILTDPFDKEFTSSMVHIARALGMKTVAEGIENIANVALLKELKVDAIQGYVMHKPESLQNIINDLASKT